MKSVALIAVIAALAHATVLATFNADASFSLWKQKYGKVYLSAVSFYVEMKRKKIPCRSPTSVFLWSACEYSSL